MWVLFKVNELTAILLADFRLNSKLHFGQFLANPWPITTSFRYGARLGQANLTLGLQRCRPSRKGLRMCVCGGGVFAHPVHPVHPTRFSFLILAQAMWSEQVCASLRVQLGLMDWNPGPDFPEGVPSAPTSLGLGAPNSRCELLVTPTGRGVKMSTLAAREP